MGTRRKPKHTSGFPSPSGEEKAIPPNGGEPFPEGKGSWQRGFVALPLGRLQVPEAGTEACLALLQAPARGAGVRRPRWCTQGGGGPSNRGGRRVCSTRLCPAKSRKYLTTATYPNERWGMEALHLPVRVVAPKWSHSTQRLALRIALAGLSVKHFANGRASIPHLIFSAECAESRFIQFV